MTSMEDLISTISGGMHVSQDGYDLKALQQEYLSRTMALPGLQPLSSPTIPFHAIPTSRSTSTARKAQSYFDIPNTYQSYSYPTHAQTNTFGQSASAEDVSQPAPQRPNFMKRSSSYGYGEIVPEPVGEGFGFESDAFAPLRQQQCTAGPSDPWGIVKDKVDPWSGFGGNASVFGKGKGESGDAEVQVSIQERGVSESEDEDMEMEMDEDGVEDMMGMEDEDEEEERVERAMGLGTGGGNALVQQGGDRTWDAAGFGSGQNWNGFGRGRPRE